MMHSRLYSLDEIDFDAMFEASLPAMDAGTYAWPNPRLRAKGKRDAIYNHMNIVLNLSSGFGYKGILDGVIVSAGVGLLQGDTFKTIIGLTHPDKNGSRSFAYDQVWLKDYRSFLKKNGANVIEATVPPNSAVLKNFPDRHDMSNAEYETCKTPGPSRGHVCVRIPI